MASYIELRNIKKQFKVPIRKSGLKEAFKAFFKREYKQILAVDDISFQIEKGEIVGYIGPNGAGKSTTIKMLTGILTPTSGMCVVDGMTKICSKNRCCFWSKKSIMVGYTSN